MSAKNDRNKKEDIREIRAHLRTLNDEMGAVKLEMATKFGEILVELAKMKVSKKENLYAVIVPILMAIIGVMLGVFLSKFF